MASVTVESVAEIRAKIEALGPRPTHEEVEQAQQALSEIDSQLEEQLESIYDPTAAPPGVNVVLWRESKESELQEAAETEKIPHKSVIQLDELQQSYEDLLEEQERALDGWGSKVPSVPANTDDGDNADAAHLLQDALQSNQETLDLSKQSLSHIPESFGQITNLVKLDLSNNKLQMLPDSVAGLVNLVSLNLNSNHLKILPDSIGLLTKLKYLDVSSNALKRLPDSLGQCRALVELNANFNHLGLLSASFAKLLMSLQKLDLHLNKLSSIPFSICELKSLKFLDLHMNKLRGLPVALGNLSTLEYLDVSSNFNDLTSLPESFGDMISLRYCDLSFNQIKELPDSLGRLQSLTTLKLDGNPMVVPPMEVVECGHEAVMVHMLHRWKQSIAGGPPNSEGSNAGSQSDYNGWIPSSIGTWLGSWWGSTGTMSEDRTVGFSDRAKDAFLEQQL